MAWISERAPWLTQLDWRGWVEFTIVVGTALIALLNGTWRRYGEPWWDGQSLKRTEKAAFQIVQKYNVAKRCLENPAVAIAQFSQIICAIIIGAAGMVMAATVAMNWVIGHEGSSYTVDTLHIVITPALLLAY
jgi:thiosulfate reductase cytochrome b subunit